MGQVALQVSRALKNQRRNYKLPRNGYVYVGESLLGVHLFLYVDNVMVLHCFKQTGYEDWGVRHRTTHAPSADSTINETLRQLGIKEE